MFFDDQDTMPTDGGSETTEEAGDKGEETEETM